jgi:xylulokinase
MAKYLAGVDVGTTGVRCMLFDLQGTMVASDYREYGATYPKPGWVEQDGTFMITQTMAACKVAVAKSGVHPPEIGAIGFSTQRSVTVSMDKAGTPVCSARAIRTVGWSAWARSSLAWRLSRWRGRWTASVA